MAQLVAGKMIMSVVTLHLKASFDPDTKSRKFSS